MLGWKEEGRFQSNIRRPMSRILMIPVMYLILNTIVQFWEMETPVKGSLDVSDGFRTRNLLLVSKKGKVNCTQPSILDFPDVNFPGGQTGQLLIPLFFCIYLYILLARVCDDYFIASIKIICSKIGFSGDVAGATLMAAATSSPELFVNLVGTFITEGDIGVGTIIGSAVFNILAVPGLCGLFSASKLKTIKLDYWPLLRDSIIYCFSLLLLCYVLRDGKIQWYEAFVMVISYAIFIIMMSYNSQIRKFFEVHIFRRSPQSMNIFEDPETWPLLNNKTRGKSNPLVQWFKKFKSNGYIGPNKMSEKISQTDLGKTVTNNLKWNKICDTTAKQANSVICQIKNSVPQHLTKENCHSNGVSTGDLSGIDPDELEGSRKLCCWPPESSIIHKIWWLFTFPITFALACTVPNCRVWRKLYILTFILCMSWIALASYLIAWMITITGFVLRIPDSVMGLTFIAAGMCIPETISSIIVSKQGHGSMALANALGSNIFDTLFCFGLPWLVKTTYFMSTSKDGHFIKVSSKGLPYDTIILLLTLVLLFIVVAVNKFQLTKRVGYTCILMYFIFISFSVVIELHFFIKSALPSCTIAP